MRKRKHKPIDKVTINILDVALRSCGIMLPLDVIDKTIDLVELIEDTKGKTTLEDISNLQQVWKNQRI